MNEEPRLVLWVEADPSSRREHADELAKAGFEVRFDPSFEKANSFLDANKKDIGLVIVDLYRSRPANEAEYFWLDEFVFQRHHGRSSVPYICISPVSPVTFAQLGFIEQKDCYFFEGAGYDPVELTSAARVAVDRLREPLYTSQISSIAVADFRDIGEELMARLARDPALIHSLGWREFEMLVARLFADLGYEVELGPGTGDGGVDIRALRRDDVGPILYVVQCKKYRPDRRVGPDMVRGLYGAKEAYMANAAVLATTSYFTEGAKEFQRCLGSAISLKDFDDLQKWLARYRI